MHPQGPACLFLPPFTEETEAIGLSRIAALTGLKPERARSGSADIGWSREKLDLNFSMFTSNVRNTLLLVPSLATRNSTIANSECNRTYPNCRD